MNRKQGLPLTVGEARHVASEIHGKQHIDTIYVAWVIEELCKRVESLQCAFSTVPASSSGTLLAGAPLSPQVKAALVELRAGSRQSREVNVECARAMLDADAIDRARMEQMRDEAMPAETETTPMQTTADGAFIVPKHIVPALTAWIEEAKKDNPPLTAAQLAEIKAELKKEYAERQEKRFLAAMSKNVGKAWTHPTPADSSRVGVLRISRDDYGRVSNEIVADTHIPFDGKAAAFVARLGYPGGRIFGISPHVFFHSDDYCLKIEHESIPERKPDEAFPELKLSAFAQIRDAEDRKVVRMLAEGGLLDERGFPVSGKSPFVALNAQAMNIDAPPGPPVPLKVKTGPIPPPWIHPAVLATKDMDYPETRREWLCQMIQLPSLTVAMNKVLATKNDSTTRQNVLAKAKAFKDMIAAGEDILAESHVTMPLSVPVCECGGEASGVGTHSSWCPKYQAST